MELYNKIKNNKAFTLVELLIVVVIIGILSGVVITVINPITQQNRAKDAVTVASINKIVLATEAYTSAYTESPSAEEFIKGLTNPDEVVGSCNGNTCLFSLDSSPLPKTCSTNYWGDGTNQCYFYYEKGEGPTEFYVYAKAHGTDRLYKYSSTEDYKKLQLCQNIANPDPEDTDQCTDM